MASFCSSGALVMLCQLDLIIINQMVTRMKSLIIVEARSKNGDLGT